MHKTLQNLKARLKIQASHNKAVTASEIARGFMRHPSITKLLPWRDYNDEHQLILLEDNLSVGMAFDIIPVSCEAKPQGLLETIAKGLADAVKDAIPLERDNPWILQTYAEKVTDLSDTWEAICRHVPDERKETSLTQAYLATLKEHLEYVRQPRGIFFDNQVTQQHFRAGLLRIRMVLYRRLPLSKNVSREIAIADIKKVSQKLIDQLKNLGFAIKRLSGSQFQAWLTHWFNPNPTLSQGDMEAILTTTGAKPYGFDLSEQLFFNAPESFNEGWFFDGLPHKVITIQSLSINPEIGHVSAERKKGLDDKLFNLMDQLPEKTIFCMTIVFQAQSEVERHLQIIEKSAVGRHAKAMQIKEEVALADSAIAEGDYLFPVVMAVYLQASDLSELHIKQAQAEVLLNSNGFKTITQDEVFPVDAYLRYLPMAYDYRFDKNYSYRSRYMTLSTLAKLLPFYGRSRGSKHPGLVFFNRGGEPWFYDILKDKTKNAHFLLLGETGTGKSNTLNYIILQMLACYHPRVFIIDVGGSYALLGKYCQSLGLSVNTITIDFKAPVSLNPFADGLKLLLQVDALDNHNQHRFLEEACERLTTEAEDNKTSDSNSEIALEGRDILGDMMLAALLMITGGEKKEEERLRRSDRILVMDAIVMAARRVKDQGGRELIASDIVDALDSIVANLDPTRELDKIVRAREMADGLRYFTKDPLSHAFFNTPGQAWVDADVTIIDFGLFANEGYEAQRSIAFAGCIQKMAAIAEKNQYSNRPMVSIFDENHLFSKVPLLATMQTRIAKMGRKLGWWLGVATQNLKDFADESRKMLSLMETWICLALSADEIGQIEQFKTLTPERRELFLSARKEKGKYTEGVILTPNLQALFRNVPPRLFLALAMTEQEEKYQRKVLMQEHNCTELEAAMLIAKQMMQPLRNLPDD